MRVRLEQDGATVALDGQPLARGGEAAIYPLPDRPGLLAKVYHQPTPEHADKLAAMIANPPADPTAKQGHTSIAWPTDRLLAENGGAFVGFLMPRVDKVQSLFEVYNPKSRMLTWPLFHYGYLLRTARNLAIAVRALHARGYVLGDLNESNVLVNGQALVTVVDTDSFQTRTPDRVFRCMVGKPEYVAPEIQNARFADIDRVPEHDHFALAVLIFQLLMQGTHPFAGRFTGAGEPESLAKRIAAGHWPYARKRSGPYEHSTTAPPFAVLPTPLRELMRLGFEDGHARPSMRPDAGRWQKALAEADAELVECPANPQHRFHKDLNGCPWCELMLKQGRDPFPSKDKIQARTDGPGGDKPPPKGDSVFNEDGTVKGAWLTGGHKPPPSGNSVPKSKPAGSAPPPRPPSSKPAVQPSRKKVVSRSRITGFLSHMLTPWPWVLAAGVAALGVLVWLIASKKHEPTTTEKNPPPMTTETDQPKEITNSIGMKLVRIPAGTFKMGSPDSDKEASDDEKPQHDVEIKRPFYLGVYPVTKAQYRAFVSGADYWEKAEGAKDKVSWKMPLFHQTDDDPVVYVSWNDAVKFCEWLSEKDKKTYGLPTEAEWEYACRAGTPWVYSFGDDPKRLDDYAWFQDNAGDHTHPVGGKKPNAWGLYDMHGNVWQWCADRYGRYDEKDNKDPKDKDIGNIRILRGGSWNDGPRRCRSANRYDSVPVSRDDGSGFRVVLRLPARNP